MRNIVFFIGGFFAGILVTILVGYFIVLANKPVDNGLIGFTMFSKKGECLSTTSKYKSSEIDIFQVIEPSIALGVIKYYSDRKLYGGNNYRDYDIANDVVVLLVNSDGKTFYDDQKIETSNKCVRQIGSYQYTTKDNFEKTVPAVDIE
jgi:hypothetical protein